ncbi:mechanosensitive ion channel family protein [Xanthomonas translucens pv. undulosa]|nr:Ion channel protein [Xanthomonas translucens pv. undulosa]QSQ43435.1 mechanosensitive ion channel family protein [Xanthomonas translucens pv. translucens]UKE45476.1 mechanosensitive ion channel family protein [Xanthomonas translucens pv. secalis]MBC3972083.1 mechanosensitive ion channel family protein [Xanthomonas translucens pv. undulosa]QEN95648.1 mechanosensitive ion channel family protein [Xanthomonas translucens pv. undulosa]
MRRSLLLLFLCLSAAATAQPQDEPQAPDPQALLSGAEQTLQDARRGMDNADDQEVLRKLIGQVADAQRDAEAAVAALTPQLAQVDARLKQLGEPAAGEASDIVAQRKDLAKQRAPLDSGIKRGKLLVLDAKQLGEQIEALQAEHFSQELSMRSDSPLSPTLWRQIASDFPDDRDRLLALYQLAAQALDAAIAENGTGALGIGLSIAFVLLFPLRYLLRWLGKRYAMSRAPGSRLRRSGLALWFLLLGTLTSGLAALVLAESLRSIGAVPARLESVLRGFVVVSFAAAFMGSLGASVLLPNQPSWRLFPIDDATARRLRKYTWATATLAWVSSMLLVINRASHTSASATVAADGLIALAYAVLILAILTSLSRLRRRQYAEAAAQALENGQPPPPGQHGGALALVGVLVRVAVVVALLAALLGYLYLGLFITRQIIWITMVVGAIRLLMTFADDFALWLFASEGRLGRAANGAFGVRASRLEQAGVLTSAVVRVALLLIGLGALLMPFGTNTSTVADWFSVLSQGIPIGKDNHLYPVAVLKAVLVLGLSLLAVQYIHGWLTQTYLPKTELDDGSRNSISTVARYVGILLAVLCALAWSGIDVAQIALVVSALSVGIGFGLQSIIQNFVSGLILLAERPVKIGDWVKIGDQEGDVRKISVRSTEIQVGDRSTLIVPNSELITKTLRNMTLAGPLGRVQIQFAVSLGTDVVKLRTLLLELYAAHPGVLQDPEPSVFIDSIASGHVTLNSFAYVGNPRLVYGIRSDLFFSLLQRLAEEGIALESPQEVRLLRKDP